MIGICNKILVPKKGGSIDGKYQTAVAYDDYIYVSNDYGNTWNSVGTIKDWIGVSINSTGQYQTAVADYKYISISHDYGATWTTDILYGQWTGCSMSSTGQYQVIIGNNEETHISSDYGATWNATGAFYRWTDVSMSSTGQYITVSGNGYLGVSQDWGNTWEFHTIQYAGRVSMSSSGQYQAAKGDMIYISDDYGSTWSGNGIIDSWHDVSVSSTGEFMIATTSEDYRRSYDYGNTWESPSIRFGYLSGWLSCKIISISSTGQYMAVIQDEDSEQLLISNDYGNTWTTAGMVSDWRWIEVNKYVE